MPWRHTRRVEPIEMTALNFVVHPDGILFATDTLALAADTKRPFVFLTKFVLLPHIDLAVVGTGDAQFLNEWFGVVRTSFVVRDIDHLNQFCPKALAELHARHNSQERGTSTAYHFGYSSGRKRYVGYAYRSTKNFVPDELADGFGIKPETSVTIPADLKFPQFFVEVMQKQAAEDRIKPITERLGIGGDVHFVRLANGEASVHRCHRFPDFEADFKAMCIGLSH